MAKVTLDQKRLENLRRQLQGKAPAEVLRTTPTEQNTSPTEATSRAPQQSISDSTTYLKQDLRKILILSVLAIVFQLCLYLSLSKHLINF